MDLHGASKTDAFRVGRKEGKGEGEKQGRRNEKLKGEKKFELCSVLAHAPRLSRSTGGTQIDATS